MENRKPPETTNEATTAIRPFFRLESNAKLTDSYLEEKARAELNEDPTKTANEIECLRAALAKEKKLNPDTSETFLLRYLRARKFDQARTLKLIRRYYGVKKDFPSVYQDLIPSKCRDLLKASPFYALPYPDKEGRAIVVFDFGKWDVDKINVDQIQHAIILALETVLEEKCFQICGINAILDIGRLGIQHIMRFTPRNVHRGVNIFQEWEPLRLKGAFVVRENVLFDILFQFIKPFLGQKLRSRIHLLGKDLKALHEHLPADILPSDLGGTIPSDENMQRWFQHIMQKNDIFTKRDSYGYKT